MKRVLVIDDERLIRCMLRDMLEPEGFDVLEACDGKEGMNLIRESLCDLVITDLYMPGQEGIETIAQLRREYPDVRIIAISGGIAASPPVDLLFVASCLGADSTLAKPFRRTDLLNAVETVMREVVPV